MCGIAGVMDLARREAVSPRVLDRMAGVMAHRGPDNQGVYIDDFVGLAHRRLAIIDPSPAGNQPMVSPDGHIAVVFNGTIYNFMELRSLLQARGHTFVSACDTEVLVHGWEQWGEALVEKLNGHFAFVIWDAQKQLLHLVRDRFGTKPLYFARVGGMWLFASEIKAIMAHPAYSMDLNYDALYEYFTFQNLFRYHTLFKGVNLVPAAKIMTIDARTGKDRRRLYWDYDYCFADESMDQHEAQGEVQRLLVAATRRQLVADVPVGAYLSGGLDSGSLVAIASGEMDHMHTFTCS